MMLRAFPDYGKSPPEYVASITALLAEYPANIQERLANTRFGVPSKTEFLPTPKIITELAEKWMQHEREMSSLDAKFTGRIARDITPRAPFRPFPQLWAEFGSDFMDSRVRDGIQFEVLESACQSLVVNGRSVAETILLAPRNMADAGNPQNKENTDGI